MAWAHASWVTQPPDLWRPQRPTMLKSKKNYSRSCLECRSSRHTCTGEGWQSCHTTNHETQSWRKVSSMLQSAFRECFLASAGTTLRLSIRKELKFSWPIRWAEPTYPPWGLEGRTKWRVSFKLTLHLTGDKLNPQKPSTKQILSNEWYYTLHWRICRLWLSNCKVDSLLRGSSIFPLSIQ